MTPMNRRAFLVLPLALVPLAGPAPQPRRTLLWNRFIASARQSWDGLHIVEDWLQAESGHDALDTLDASALVALDRAIRGRDQEQTLLRELQKELTGGNA